MVFKACESGDYVNDFRIAGKVRIAALIKQGVSAIKLHEDLYDVLGVETDAEKRSVLFAVQDFKDAQLISKTDTRGLYSVV